MFQIVRHDHNIDFMSKAPFFIRLTLASIVASLVLMFIPGLKFGLDFTGGYEVLLAFDKQAEAGPVRDVLSKLDLGDFAVQSFSVPDSPKTHFLVRVQRSQVLSAQEIAALNGAFSKEFGEGFKGPLAYNPEMGHVIEVEFAQTASVAQTSSAALSAVVASTGHSVSRIRHVGRPDQVRYSIVMRGIDGKIVSAMQKAIDPAANSVRTEFVGPTVSRMRS